MALAVSAVGASVDSAPVRRAPDPIPLALQRLLPTLTEALQAGAPDARTRVGAMASYHLGWTEADGSPRAGGSGKLLRGTLALWAAERCGGSVTAALPAATAVEWLHNFTLVHDDIQDGDRERRHRPTVWAIWGEAQAINAGDGLHAVAFRALLGGRDRPLARMRAAAAINHAILEVIEGQCLDLALEGRVDTTPATYLRLVRAKTGALIGAALQAGALLGGAGARQAVHLGRAGVELGVAFQMRDDWLGTWGDTSMTGKACTSDLERRKLTYPVVVALARLRGSARRELHDLYSGAIGSEDRILGLLEEAHAADEVLIDLGRHSREAVALAGRAGLPSPAVEEFTDIVEFVARRAA